MANYRLRWSRTNNLKLKVSSRIPAQLVGGNGIAFTRSNATYTIDLDINELTTATSIETALEATAYFPFWQSTGSAFGKISITNFKAEVGFPASTTDNAVARYDGTTGALQNSGVLIDDSNNVVPATDDGGALGTTALKWSDLHLALGGVINWNNGDVLATHSANALAFTGASSGYSFDAAVLPSANDVAALGSATVSWSDAFFASGGVLNWNNGNITVTHSAGNLTLAGGTLTLPNAGLIVGASVPFSDSGGTLTLQNVDALDATTEATIEAAIDTLANLTSIQGFTFTLTAAFIRSGAHSLTLTTTGATNATFPSGTITLVDLASSQALTNKTYNGNTWTAGTGVLTLGAGKTLTASNTLTFTGTDGSSVSFGAGGTVTYTSNNLSVFAATTSAQLAGVISDETGSGALVFGTSPSITTPSFPSYVQFTEIASPSNPAANDLRVFAKDVAGATHLFSRDSAGTEVDMTAGGGGGAAAATQAEMEAASSTTVYASPGRTQYHPGVAKYWAYLTNSGGTYTLQGSYNHTSISDDGVGSITLTIATDFSGVTWASVGTLEAGGSFFSFVGSTKAAGSIQTAMRTHDNTTTDASFSVAAFGDQA